MAENELKPGCGRRGGLMEVRSVHGDGVYCTFETARSYTTNFPAGQFRINHSFFAISLNSGECVASFGREAAAASELLVQPEQNRLH
jgi:hypothetical protein